MYIHPAEPPLCLKGKCTIPQGIALDIALDIALATAQQYNHFPGYCPCICTPYFGSSSAAFLRYCSARAVLPSWL